MSTQARIERVAARFEDLGIDGLLVSNLTNVRYLSGFSGTNGQVLVTPSRAVFLSDPRYRARAADLVTDADIVIYQHKLLDELPGLLGSSGVARLGIEAGTVTVSEKNEWARALGGTDLVDTDGVVEDLRRTKNSAELAAIEKAVELSDHAFERIIEALVPGVEERTIALELEIIMRESGAEAASFDPIVGSGPLSAHIHHTASARPFEKGDLVLMDLGARVDGYCSDITRTVVLGPASEIQTEIYGIVLAAQQAGIEAMRSGAAGADVDAAARSVITEAGYGEQFGHGLGHGVGLDIHEAPRLARISTDTLREGDVITVEPGIYVPDLGGIRIEDDVYVSGSGPVVLNKAPKETLIEL